VINNFAWMYGGRAGYHMNDISKLDPKSGV